MTLLPSSLRGRTLLVVFAAVLISQLITHVFIWEYKRFAVFSTAAVVSRYVNLLRVAMTVSPKESHAVLLETLHGRSGTRSRPGEAPPASHGESSSFARLVAESLSPELDLGTALPAAHENSGSGMAVGFEAGGEQHWLLLDGPALAPWRPWLMLAGTIGAVLALSAFLVHNMTRPLRSLSEAARAFGTGLAKPVVPAGPREIRELAEGFNGMLKQIEANDRERDVMLAGLPHDLRTPISRLKVRAELIDNEDARDGFRRDVQDIEHIAEQFVQYVRCFGAPDSARATVDFAALVAERVGRWVSSGNDVRFCAPPDGVVTAGDGVALSRLVDNLIGNAVQHGSPPIELAVAKGETGSVMLVVRDHGSGIPESERSQALEPFTKISRDRGTKGSVGLGLAIVTRVARSHGGVVQLRNLGNAGFEVQVTLAPCQPRPATAFP